MSAPQHHLKLKSPVSLFLRSACAFTSATFVAAALAASALFAAGTAHAAGDELMNQTDGSLQRAEKTLREIGMRTRDTASEITSYALSLIGVDYKFGGNTPDQGLDCSGLIRYVFLQATGISLPRTAREQARVGQSVSLEKLQPGDLVFFNTRRFQFSHVGLYLGDNRFIHAPSRGGSVEVVNLDQRYWQRAFNGARRVVEGLPRLNVVSPTSAASPRITPGLLAISGNDGSATQSGSLTPAPLMATEQEKHAH